MGLCLSVKFLTAIICFNCMRSDFKSLMTSFLFISVVSILLVSQRTDMC